MKNIGSKSQKRNIILAFLAIICILSACNKNPNFDAEAYKEKLDINYFGVNGKTFTATITNDKNNLCKINKKSDIKNGDTIALECSDHKNNIDFKKEFKIEGLLDDKLSMPNVQNAIISIINGTDYYMTKQENLGFTVITFNREDENYVINIYKNLFCKNGSLLQLKKEAIDGESIKSNDIKDVVNAEMIINVKNNGDIETKLDSYKKRFLDQGFKLFEGMKSK